MVDEELEKRLRGAGTLDEVNSLLKDEPRLDPKKVYEEIKTHRSKGVERLDLGELESVSGGKDRDWGKDGCAATVEWYSWCWSNDWCATFDVTYDNFWATWPDGHPHVFDSSNRCTRCGYNGQDAVTPGY